MNSTHLYVLVCASLIAYEESGGLLLFHIVSNTVPSADQGLTIVFGMGTGVSPDRIATGKITYHRSCLRVQLLATTTAPIGSVLLVCPRQVSYGNPYTLETSLKQA